MDNLEDSELVELSPTSSKNNAVLLAAAIAQNHATVEPNSEEKKISESKTSADAINPSFGVDVTEEEEPIWYLAYGSNLNSKVFKGRRGIKPLDQKNVFIPGLELTFDLPGIPYVEPRFANTRFAESELEAPKDSNGNVVHLMDKKSSVDVNLTVRTVHSHFKPDDEGYIHLNGPWTGKGALIGVAYLVTPNDFAQILATEGGGSSYEMVSVEAHELSPSSTESDEGGDKEAKLKVTGKSLKVFTLCAPKKRTRETVGYPSLRYLTLIRDGAKEHALPKPYIKYLNELNAYAVVSFRQKVGRALLLGFCAPILIGIVLLGKPFSDKDGRSPLWLTQLREKVFGTVWDAYDRVWKWRFGDGEGSSA